MKWLPGLVLGAVFLTLPAAASAQTNSGANSLAPALQGSAGALQQPGSGFQGTSPQNLAAPSVSSLNQNTYSINTSTIPIGPSETSTTITPIKDETGLNFFQIILLPVILMGAGLVLWRQSIKE